MNNLTVTKQSSAVYDILELWEASGPRILVGGPEGIFTSSFASLGRSSRIIHAPNSSVNSKVFGKYQNQVIRNQKVIELFSTI